MRITEGIIANNILGNLQLGQQQLERLQQQASTGMRINAPGDDPVSTQQVLQLKGVLQDYDQYTRNIITGSAWLGQSDNTMAGMGSVVARAHEIAMTMANGSYSATNRANAAVELKQLRSELIQQGNSQMAGRYIFGGFASDKPPFDATTGAYAGSDDAVKMEVGQGSYVSINYPGSRLLSGGTPPGSSGVDIIGELDKLTTALSTNDVTGIRAALPAMDAAQSQILAARTDVGGRMNRVQNAASNLESLKLSQTAAISDRQDVDILQVISDLTRQQTAFQAALSSAAKTSKLSLLDYL